MSVEIIVREALMADHAQIAQLMTQYDLVSPSFENWQHLWTANPVVLEREPKWPIGWVLEKSDEKKVVGFLANIPLEYFYNHKSYIAATASSWVVDKQFRKQNILLSESFFSQKRPALFLNTPAFSTKAAIADVNLPCG